MQHSYSEGVTHGCQSNIWQFVKALLLQFFFLFILLTLNLWNLILQFLEIFKIAHLKLSMLEKWGQSWNSSCVKLWMNHNKDTTLCTIQRETLLISKGQTRVYVCSHPLRLFLLRRTAKREECARPNFEFLYQTREFSIDCAPFFFLISIFFCFICVCVLSLSLTPNRHIYPPINRERERSGGGSGGGGGWGGGWPSCTEMWAWGRLSTAVCITSLCLINIRNGSVG